MADQGQQAVSVFISYRREGGFYLAKNIYDHLKQCGFDVFMDVHQLGAGQFEHVTLAQIRSRDYFVIVLTKGSLNRLRDPDDWLKKEILTALDATRTIIPVLDVDFSFEASEVRDILAAAPKAVREIAGFNAVRMPFPEYFEDGLERLRRFLRESPPAVTAPPARSGELREAERHLEKHGVPSPRTLTKEERTARSWHELNDRLMDKSPSSRRAKIILEQSSDKTRVLRIDVHGESFSLSCIIDPKYFGGNPKHSRIVLNGKELEVSERSVSRWLQWNHAYEYSFELPTRAKLVPVMIRLLCKADSHRFLGLRVTLDGDIVYAEGKL